MDTYNYKTNNAILALLLQLQEIEEVKEEVGLISNGDEYETHAGNFFTSSNAITLRDGAETGMGSNDFTGFITKLYDGINDGQLVIGSDGFARVGDVGDLQILATRQTSPIANGIAFWNATNKRFDTKAENTLNVANSDTVDNLHASQFVRSDANDTVTGSIAFKTIQTFSRSTTIGNTNLAGAYALFGTTSSGIGIDSNEIKANGTSIDIGTGDANALKLTTNSVVRLLFDSGGNGRFYKTVDFGYYWSTKSKGINLSDGANNALSFYDGADTSARIYRDNNIFYVGARGGNNAGGLQIDSSGNVGIGKTPSYKLDVATNEASKYVAQFTQSNVGGYGMAIYAPNTVDTRSLLRIWNDSNDQVFRVQADGKVGIGRTPTQALDVEGNIQSTGFYYPRATVPSVPTGKGLEIGYYSNSDYGRILSYDRSTSARKPLHFDGNPIEFKINGDRGKWTTTGLRVGDNGTASEALDVIGNIVTSGHYKLSNQNKGLVMPNVSNSATPTYLTSGNAITGGADYAGLGKLNNVAVQTWYGFSVSPTISGQAVAQGTPAFSVNARTGQSWIAKSLKIGGSSNSIQALDVDGWAQSSYGLIYKGGYNSISKIVVGNIEGSGTAANNGIEFQRPTGSGTSTHGWRFQVGGYSGSGNIHLTYGGSYSDGSHVWSNKFTFTNGGSLGINKGNTAPTEALDVNGNVLINSDDTSDALTVNNNSNGFTTAYISNAGTARAAILRGGGSTGIAVEIRNSTNTTAHWFYANGNQTSNGTISSNTALSVKSLTSNHRLTLSNGNDFYNDTNNSHIWITSGGGSFKNGEGAHMVLETRKSMRNIYLKVGDTTAAKHIFHYSGNVGINTGDITPAEVLHVNGNVQANSFIRVSNSETDVITAKRTDETLPAYIKYSGGGHWIFETPYTNRTFTFKRGVVKGTDTLVKGFTGLGSWGIDQDEDNSGLNHLYVDRLTVRERMDIYELVVNQIRASNGSIWVSDAMKITDFTPRTDYDEYSFNIQYDSDGGNRALTFVVNDIIKAQKFDGRNVIVVYGKVDYISSSSNYFRLRTSGYSNTSNSGDLSKYEGLEFVRIGNTSDYSRQGALYLTSSDNGAPYMDIIDGVTNGNLANKTRLRVGKLDGITGQLGYGIWGTVNGTDEAFVISSGYVSGGGAYARIAGWSFTDKYLEADGIRIATAAGGIDGAEIRISSDKAGTGTSNFVRMFYGASGDNYGIQGVNDALESFYLGEKDGVIASHIGGINFNDSALYTSDDTNTIHLSLGYAQAWTSSVYGLQVGQSGSERIWLGMNSGKADLTYTSSGKYVFRLGGVANQIADWNFNNEAIYKDSNGISLSLGTAQGWTSSVYGLNIGTSVSNRMYMGSYSGNMEFAYQENGNYIFRLGSAANRIGAWDFDYYSIWSGEKLYGSGAGVEMSNSPKMFSAHLNSTNYTRLFYSSSSNWGVEGKYGGDTFFRLGSENHIANWNFDSTSIYHTYSSYRHIILSNSESESSTRGKRGFTIYNDDAYVGTYGFKIARFGMITKKDTTQDWTSNGTEYGIQVGYLFEGDGYKDVFRIGQNEANIGSFNIGWYSLRSTNLELINYDTDFVTGQGNKAIINLYQTSGVSDWYNQSSINFYDLSAIDDNHILRGKVTGGYLPIETGGAGYIANARISTANDTAEVIAADDGAGNYGRVILRADTATKIIINGVVVMEVYQGSNGHTQFKMDLPSASYADSGCLYNNGAANSPVYVK